MTLLFIQTGISVQRIAFDEEFLLSFFDNCVGPEIVSPLYPLGLPMRNLLNSN